MEFAVGSSSSCAWVMLQASKLRRILETVLELGCFRNIMVLPMLVFTYPGYADLERISRSRSQLQHEV